MWITRTARILDTDPPTLPLPDDIAKALDLKESDEVLYEVAGESLIVRLVREQPRPVLHSDGT